MPVILTLMLIWMVIHSAIFRWTTFAIIGMVLPSGLGGEFENDVCEYDDAIVRFPDTSTSSVGDIRAKTWNKDTNIRLATWMDGGKFVPLSTYEDRLMVVGENNIKIRNVTWSDTGVYTLVLTSGSIQDFLDYTSHLTVTVSPTNQCIPSITRKGDDLMAALPPNDCGIPALSVKWMNTNQTTSISGNTSVLHLRKDARGQEVYTACAIGKSLSCYHGDAGKLCSNYSEISPLESQTPPTPVSVAGIIAVTIFYVVIGIAFGLVLWKRKSVRKKLFSGTETSEAYNDHEEESCLVTNETNPEVAVMAEKTEVLPDHTASSITDIEELKKYLISQYKRMKGVSLDPSNDERCIDVSRVYCELEIKHLGTLDEDCTPIPQAQNKASESEILYSMDTINSMPAPALILGECGVGKTTWCKHLVDQWCQYHARKMSAVERTDSDSNVADIGRFELLLYIPLKLKHGEVSFNEHLKELLFAEKPELFDYTTKYISENRDTVLLLVDGFDEVIYNHVSMETLLKEISSHRCLITFTSRPIGLKHLQKIGISLRLFQMEGMTPDKSKDFASKVLNFVCQRRGETLNIDHFWIFTKHMQVQSMCNTPLLCLSLILFWINTKTVSGDLTEIVCTIVADYVRHAMARVWYSAVIGKEKAKQLFDISQYISKPRYTHYLKEHTYQLKVVSDIAENLVNGNEETVDIAALNQYSENTMHVQLCLETGILIAPIFELIKERKIHLSFSHSLLFEFFVALSIVMEKRELFTQYMTTKEEVLKNCHVIHITCQMAPRVGKCLMSNISKIFAKGGHKSARDKSEQKLICEIKCKGTSCKWLKNILWLNTLSNENLSLLSDSMAFANNLTHLILELPENINELTFRLPLLLKLEVLRIVIGNCTLLLLEEKNWKKEKLSNLKELVIKSLHLDTTTAGYLFEAIKTCKDLITFEICPKQDYNEVDVAPDNLKPLYNSQGLAEAVEYMTKLKIFRLHNCQVGEQLPALLDSLCSSKMIEILDLVNLTEIFTGERLETNDSVQEYSACRHETTNGTHKTIQLIKNAMAEKSWSVLCERLEGLSPDVLHIEQVYQPNSVLKPLLHGIGKCSNLKILSLCNIRAINESISFSALRSLKSLRKLTLCKIVIPNSSWKELFYILARLTKLEVLSLARLKNLNYFIEVQKTSELKSIAMAEINLDEGLWSKFCDEVRTLPKLKRIDLVSCRMLGNTLITFQQKMNESGFIVEKAKTFQTEDLELMSVDIIVTSKKKNRSKEAENTFGISRAESKSSTVLNV